MSGCAADNDDASDSDDFDDDDGSSRKKRAKKSKPKKKKEEQDNRPDEEILHSRKWDLREHMHMIRAIVKELTGRSRSLRYFCWVTSGYISLHLPCDVCVFVRWT